MENSPRIKLQFWSPSKHLYAVLSPARAVDKYGIRCIQPGISRNILSQY
ncbi:hypothetical protein [Pedobacter foliorum]|nr:hypothetical protein [Pedobacter foliorum]NRF37592.1 hypothetical protein [Pedobacter foliorum]